MNDASESYISKIYKNKNDDKVNKYNISNMNSIIIIILVGLFVGLLMLIWNHFKVKYSSIRKHDQNSKHNATKIIIYTEFFISKNKSRQNEIDKVLFENSRLNEIDEIKLIVHNQQEVDTLKFMFNEQKMNMRKINLIRHFHKQRSTFGDFFTIMKMSDKDEINIVANNDILFESSIGMLKQMRLNEAVVLNRYCPHTQKTNWACQDAWVIRGSPKILSESRSRSRSYSYLKYKSKSMHNKSDLTSISFTPGVFGCDPVLSALLIKNGYTLINPSLTIKSYHIHASDVRTGTRLKNYVFGKKAWPLQSHWK